MRVEGQFRFKGVRQEVWSLLMDPQALRRTIPGVQEWRQISPQEFQATMKIGIAAISGTYTGRVTTRDLVPPERYTLAVEASGGPGFIRGQGQVTLVEQDSETTMRYAGDVQVGGMLAAVGQRIVWGVAKLLIDQALGSLARQLEERLERQSP